MRNLRRPGTESQEHTDAGNHEQGLASEFVHKEHGQSDGNQERPDGYTAVDKSLIVRLFDTNTFKDGMEVV